jgi:hypothetical protein
MIIKDSNAIQMQYNGGNITGAKAVDLVDLFVQSVFFSSEGVELDPTACDVNGFATLACQTSPRSIPTMGEDKIRAVTLAGVLAPEAWATGGKPLIKTINSAIILLGWFALLNNKSTTTWAGEKLAGEAPMLPLLLLASTEEEPREEHEYRGLLSARERASSPTQQTLPLAQDLPSRVYSCRHQLFSFFSCDRRSGPRW